MKKFTLLLMSLLMVSIFALAQKKLCVHTIYGEKIEYIASDVAYIDFEDIATDPDDDPVVPVVPKPDAGIPDANGYEYVDLGLSSGLLWATMNVGADSPEDYGDYFAWGETEPKDEYNWSTYKWCEGSNDTQTKYCTHSYYGTVDNKTILELSDDAANANWGGDWRMPTKAEQEELVEECTWDWTTQNGVNGYKVTSKTNGNSIFLPATGYHYFSDLYDAGSSGLYWSSSLLTGYSYDAYVLNFNSSLVDWYSGYRYYGLSVRPVMK